MEAKPGDPRVLVMLDGEVVRSLWMLSGDYAEAQKLAQELQRDAGPRWSYVACPGDGAGEVA